MIQAWYVGILKAEGRQDRVMVGEKQLERRRGLDWRERKRKRERWEDGDGYGEIVESGEWGVERGRLKDIVIWEEDDKDSQIIIK